MTPQEKAAIVVGSGLPAPPGVGGVFLRRWDRDAPRPPGTLVFVDQEGGDVRAFRSLPPAAAARRIRSTEEAFAAGRETGSALRRFRASLEPETYRLLRSLGFDGVAITDSLDIVGNRPRYWPTRAMRAGAD